MTSYRIRELLAPFLEGEAISDQQSNLISDHLQLLLKWNPRINLTAVTDPEQIVMRHFGESLFAARVLAKDSPLSGSLIDLGSGAGFPGIPIKIWAPGLNVTLIEARQKKATFLREVARILGLAGLEVAHQRGELLGLRADVVTIRAVEKFDKSLPVAASLVRRGGRLALLIGAQQVSTASSLLPELSWGQPIPLPQSSARVVLVGRTPQ